MARVLRESLHRKRSVSHRSQRLHVRHRSRRAIQRPISSRNTGRANDAGRCAAASMTIQLSAVQKLEQFGGSSSQLVRISSRAARYARRHPRLSPPRSHVYARRMALRLFAIILNEDLCDLRARILNRWCDAFAEHFPHRCP